MAEGDMLDNQMIFECGGCKHRWLVKLKLPMEIGKFTGQMKDASKCPKCGKGNAFILYGEKYREALKELETCTKR